MCEVYAQNNLGCFSPFILTENPGILNEGGEATKLCRIHVRTEGKLNFLLFNSQTSGLKWYLPESFQVVRVLANCAWLGKFMFFWVFLLFTNLLVLGGMDQPLKCIKSSLLTR